jgi:hypothetical protein
MLLFKSQVAVFGPRETGLIWMKLRLTIHLNAQLWTEDDGLKKGLRQKGFDLFFKP